MVLGSNPGNRARRARLAWQPIRGPDVGLSDKTREVFAAELQKKNVSGQIFSRAKGETITMMARKYLKDFVELQESKFNVAGGFEAPAEEEKNGACPLDSHPTALILSEKAKTHFAQDSKQLLKEIGKMDMSKPERETQTGNLVEDIAAIRASRKTGGKRTFFRKTAASRPPQPVAA